jgi:hypothetical protein
LKLFVDNNVSLILGRAIRSIDRADVWLAIRGVLVGEEIRKCNFEIDWCCRGRISERCDLRNLGFLFRRELVFTVHSVSFPKFSYLIVVSKSEGALSVFVAVFK